MTSPSRKQRSTHTHTHTHVQETKKQQHGWRRIESERQGELHCGSRRRSKDGDLEVEISPTSSLVQLRDELVQIRDVEEVRGIPREFDILLGEMKTPCRRTREEEKRVRDALNERNVIIIRRYASKDYEVRQASPVAVVEANVVVVAPKEEDPQEGRLERMSGAAAESLSMADDLVGENEQGQGTDVAIPDLGLCPDCAGRGGRACVGRCADGRSTSGAPIICPV